jgi:hypothetical protein
LWQIWGAASASRENRLAFLEPQKLSNDEQRGLHEELAKAMMSVQ